MLLHDHWDNDDKRKEVKKVLELNHNISELMGHNKGSPRGKITAMSAYTKNTEDLK
jgi:hypothetical protein